MSQYKSSLLNDLEQRGFLHQCTDIDALDDLLAKESVVAYIGFDATADSLHVGSLMPIMLLRKLQQHGHRVLIIMGGATTKVGDPTGKDTQRKILDDVEIEKNIAGISKVFSRYVNMDDAIVLNNNDWLKDVKYLDFLRDFGPHFTINRMMTFESVKLRLEREQPLTFLEFNYMILQAYDFMYLNKKCNCVLQMGGSDQWGNIVNGVELTRRKNGETVFGLTAPLVTTSTGEKMGKTANGAVWLSADKLSPYDFWQYWRNVTDTDVGKYLRLFTELPLDEILRLEALEGAEINEAKKILANEVTRITHGDAAVEEARATSEKLFEQHVQTDLSALPKIELSKVQLAQGIPLLDLFVMAGLVSSKGESRRLIRNGGARLNDERIDDENTILTAQDIGEQAKLSAGKKRHAMVYVK
jgi:tyrosyl-tRNA synthetase